MAKLVSKIWIAEKCISKKQQQTWIVIEMKKKTLPQKIIDY